MYDKRRVVGLDLGAEQMKFENFWTEYKRERDSYRDDAWTPILLKKISNLSKGEKQVVLDELLAMVKERRNDWYVALDALEVYGTEFHIQALEATQEIPSQQSGYIMKVLARRGEATQIIQHYLQSAKIDSQWRYVVKNVPEQNINLFLDAFERYFDEGHDVVIDFDFKTFLTYSRNKLELLKTHFKQKTEILHMLNTLD